MGWPLGLRPNYKTGSLALINLNNRLKLWVRRHGLQLLELISFACCLYLSWMDCGQHLVKKSLFFKTLGKAPCSHSGLCLLFFGPEEKYWEGIVYFTCSIKRSGQNHHLPEFRGTIDSNLECGSLWTEIFWRLDRVLRCIPKIYTLHCNIFLVT